MVEGPTVMAMPPAAVVTYVPATWLQSALAANDPSALNSMV